MDGTNNNLPIIEVNKIDPKYVAQRCPVCNGFGTLKWGEKVCNGCEGKGYVLVPNFDPKVAKSGSDKDGRKNDNANTPH